MSFIRLANWKTFSVAEKPETKVCTKCEIEKEIEEFRKRVQNSDGYNNECIKCENERCKRNREKKKLERENFFI